MFYWSGWMILCCRTQMSDVLLLNVWIKTFFDSDSIWNTKITK